MKNLSLKFKKESNGFVADFSLLINLRVKEKTLKTIWTFFLLACYIAVGILFGLKVISKEACMILIAAIFLPVVIPFIKGIYRGVEKDLDYFLFLILGIIGGIYFLASLSFEFLPESNKYIRPFILTFLIIYPITKLIIRIILEEILKKPEKPEYKSTALRMLGYFFGLVGGAIIYAIYGVLVVIVVLVPLAVEGVAGLF